jgi:dephospho-CoA kinase
MPYVVGLTGGIGSGKSAAAKFFSEFGVTVVDTDAIAHELTAPGGAAMPALAAEFGQDYVLGDGSLDRARMRATVFGNAAAKRRLEAILHPLIRVVTDERTRAAGSAYVIQVVPLLIESGNYRKRVKRVLVVDCSEEIQVERAAKRSGLDADQVRAIMRSQAPRQARLDAADDVIDNQGDLDSLRTQVAVLHARYLALAAAE